MNDKVKPHAIKVAGGGYFDLAEPDPQGVTLETIAAALSRLCRFGGHCPFFYSVAEHSVNAARFAMLDGQSREVAVATLLHDASEAFVGDMVHPLKRLLPEFSAIESRIEIAIAARFGIDIAATKAAVKAYDLQTLRLEKQQLWPMDGAEWGLLRGIPLRQDFDIEGWLPELAERNFLKFAKRLGIQPAGSGSGYGDGDGDGSGVKCADDGFATGSTKGRGRDDENP